MFAAEQREVDAGRVQVFVSVGSSEDDEFEDVDEIDDSEDDIDED
jgi:hypothetical protein